MEGRLIAMLSCKEVSRSIAADELAAAGWRRRLAVQTHLLMCRHCRRYSRQIKALGAAVRDLFSEQRPEAGERERLRESILRRIPPRGATGQKPRL